MSGKSNNDSISDNSHSSNKADKLALDLKLNETIENKLKGWDRTRHNRINASERLKSYNDIWSVLTLIMNTVAIFFVFFSFKLHNSNGFAEIISACFSSYVILLQYFLATRDYSARSLKLHYEQLEIEDLRSELKKIQLLPSSDLSLDEERISSVITRYQVSLKNSENHGAIDDKRYMNSKSKECYRVYDWTLDQLFIYANVSILVGIIFLIVWLYF